MHASRGLKALNDSALPKRFDTAKKKKRIIFIINDTYNIYIWIKSNQIPNTNLTGTERSDDMPNSKSTQRLEMATNGTTVQFRAIETATPLKPIFKRIYGKIPPPRPPPKKRERERRKEKTNERFSFTTRTRE